MDQSNTKVNLLGYSSSKLRQFLTDLGEKPFRAEQLMKWIHQFGVTDFELMTNLSKPLRAKLAEVAVVEPPKVAFKEFSADGTRKWVFDVGGNLVETVLIPAGLSDNGRKTLCISSQVGCALDCSFCSTGKQGFNRDLSASEIIGQLWVANQSYMEDVPVSERTRTVTNVVMMGMGEPLLNLSAVVPALELMLSDHAYGLSKRRVTVSTSGVVPAMYELFEAVDVALAISLHAPNNELRNQLVPINKKYPLETLIEAAQAYLSSSERSKKHVTLEYVMIDGVNDTNSCLQQLIELTAKFECKVNLIPFNPFPHSGYKRSKPEQIQRFVDQITRSGVTCTVRRTRGDDIDAACGQLAGQVADRTKRSQKWQNKVNQQLESARSAPVFHRS